MSVVNILNIQVLDNPTKFFNPFQFEITFECISPLKDGTWQELFFGLRCINAMCSLLLCVCLCVCLHSLLDLEFKIVYVGSAEDDRYDQVLDSIMVGPVPVGINKFVFQVRLRGERRRQGRIKNT